MLACAGSLHRSESYPRSIESFPSPVGFVSATASRNQVLPQQKHYASAVIAELGNWRNTKFCFSSVFHFFVTINEITALLITMWHPGHGKGMWELSANASLSEKGASPHLLLSCWLHQDDTVFSGMLGKWYFQVIILIFHKIWPPLMGWGSPAPLRQRLVGTATTTVSCTNKSINTQIQWLVQGGGVWGSCLQPVPGHGFLLNGTKSSGPWIWGMLRQKLKGIE